MNFIINSEILEPPTSLICFRSLSFWIYYDFSKVENILIETQDRQNRDAVWRFLKNSPGILDFVSDLILKTDEIVGLRLDNEPRFAPTIYAPYIREENIYNILRAVGYN